MPFAAGTLHRRCFTRSIPSIKYILRRGKTRPTGDLDLCSVLCTLAVTDLFFFPLLLLLECSPCLWIAQIPLLHRSLYRPVESVVVWGVGAAGKGLRYMKAVAIRCEVKCGLYQADELWAQRPRGSINVVRAMRLGGATCSFTMIAKLKSPRLQPQSFPNPR